MDNLSIQDIIKLKSLDLYNSLDRETYIIIAKGLTTSCFFGSKYNYAVALRACHIFTSDNRSGSESGNIKSKKEGDLSITYSNGKSSTNNEDLNSTKFGQELLGLIKSGPSASVTGTDTIFCTGV